MAYTFDGSATAMYWAAPVTAVPLTISAWFRRPTGSSSAEVVAMLLDASNGDDVTDDQWALRLQADDTLRFRCYESTLNGSATTSNTHNNDDWSHACGIAATTTSRRAVLDGDWANSGTNTNDRTPANIDRLSIGARYDDSSPGEWLTGEAAEIAIWSAALTQAEVESLAEGIRPTQVRPGSLIFYSPLARGTQEIIGAAAVTLT